MSDITLTPCTTEDGSAPDQVFPCVWDAQTSGNGTGHTFVLDSADDVAHYVTSVGTDGSFTTSDTMPLTSSEVGLAWVLAPIVLLAGLAFVLRRRTGR